MILQRTRKRQEEQQWGCVDGRRSKEVESVHWFCSNDGVSVRILLTERERHQHLDVGSGLNLEKTTSTRSSLGEARSWVRHNGNVMGDGREVRVVEEEK